MKTKSIKILGLALVLVFSLFPQNAFAGSANVYVSPGSSSVTLGNNVTVQVRMNSGTDEINTAQARINFDPSRLEYKSFSAGDFQQVSTSSGSGWFEFAGAILGSTTSGDKRIFSITFKSLKTGSAVLSISNAVAANAGTSLDVSTAGGSVSVNKPPSESSDSGSSSDSTTSAPAPSPPPSSSTSSDTESDEEEKEEKKEEPKPIKVDYRVHITDQNGQALKNHPVELHSDPIKSTTDDEGWATFESIDPGKHTLVFELDGLVMRWPVEVGQPLELADEGSGDVEDKVELPFRFAQQLDASEQSQSNPLNMLLIVLALGAIGITAAFISVRHYYRQHKHHIEETDEEKNKD